MDVVVCDAQDEEAELFEHGLAEGIALSLFIVDRTVDFDNEAGGAAVEVGDELADDLLAAEVVAVEMIGP